MSKTDLFSYLGAPLTNARWSWGARRPRDGAIFLFAWQDESKKMDAKTFTLIDNATHFGHTAGPGRSERLEHIELIRAGAPSFIVMGLALDPTAAPRVIASINQDDVFVGGELRMVSADTYLELVSRRPIAVVR